MFKTTLLGWLILLIASRGAFCWLLFQCLFLRQFHPVAEARLALTVTLLPQSLEYWDCRHEPQLVILAPLSLTSVSHTLWPECPF